MTAIQGPIRGGVARRQGLVTPTTLSGPRFRRAFPNVYLPADVPLSLENRSRAAYLLVVGRGALAGYSAAELLGARCAPPDADAEVIVPRRDMREHTGLRVHRDRLADDEVDELDGVLLTSAARTAYDLARWLALAEAVPAVDALLRAGGITCDAVRAIDERYPGARWRSRVPRVLALSDPGAESVMESRSRLCLVLRGLPAPVTQYPVPVAAGWVAHLDMAYPEARVGVEYDGAGHRSRQALARDNERHNLLLAAGWTVLRFTADDVLRTRTRWPPPSPRRWAWSSGPGRHVDELDAMRLERTADPHRVEFVDRRTTGGPAGGRQADRAGRLGAPGGRSGERPVTGRRSVTGHSRTRSSRWAGRGRPT